MAEKNVETQEVVVDSKITFKEKFLASKPVAWVRKHKKAVIGAGAAALGGTVIGLAYHAYKQSLDDEDYFLEDLDTAGLPEEDYDQLASMANATEE